MSKSKDYRASFTVDQSPEEVFNAINNVRGWWSGEITGDTNELGAEFTYCVQNVHRSKQKITEFVAGKRVVWRVLDADLSFTRDKASGKARRLCLTSQKGRQNRSALHARRLGTGV